MKMEFKEFSFASWGTSPASVMQAVPGKRHKIWPQFYRAYNLSAYFQPLKCRCFKYHHAKFSLLSRGLHWNNLLGWQAVYIYAICCSHHSHTSRPTFSGLIFFPLKVRAHRVSPLKKDKVYYCRKFEFLFGAV